MRPGEEFDNEWSDEDVDSENEDAAHEGFRAHAVREGGYVVVEVGRPFGDVREGVDHFCHGGQLKCVDRNLMGGDCSRFYFVQINAMWYVRYKGGSVWI